MRNYNTNEVNDSESTHSTTNNDSKARTDGGAMSLEIEDGTFFYVREHDSETLFETRAAAIDELRTIEMDNLDEDAISVVKVDVDGMDWAIQQLSWERIALELLRGDDK